MKQTLLILLGLIILAACNQSTKKKQDELIVRDTTITATNSFSPRFLDSTELEKFIGTRQMQDSLALRLRQFYAQRNYQYAWFTDSGFAEYGQGFAQMLNNYLAYSRDSSIYDRELQPLLDSVAITNTSSTPPQEMLKTELLLSTQFFRYAYRVYEGNSEINQADLGWFIPRKKIDPIAVLDSLVKNSKNSFETNEPLNPQYNLLKKELLRYYTIQEDLDTLKKLVLTVKNRADSSTQANLVKRLELLGDLPKVAKEDIKDSLPSAIKRFQSRHGLSVTGVVNQATADNLNAPTEERIRQLLINMERLKWVPVQASGDYILVNIPEFRLHMYEDGKYAWNMKVVVGSDANSTVIFMGMLKYVVFSPYWNVPNSIVKKEILPGIRRNRNYLANHNMEWNGGSIRQKPGPRNSLGLVKFLFPNSYNIYLHDTPSKSLFNESKRAFSHGCIRLAEPEKLAEFLLRNDSTWTADKIAQAMNAGKEKYVTLKELIPVYIGYFTCWVNKEGILNFRDDIYGHDRKMAEKLFVKEIGDPVAYKPKDYRISKRATL